MATINLHEYVKYTLTYWLQSVLVESLNKISTLITANWSDSCRGEITLSLPEATLCASSLLTEIK